MLQRSFCVAYWNYINNLISPHNEDGKHQGQKWFWSYIKSLKQDYSGVSSLKHNGKLVTDSIGKAEVLNTQFQSVFTQDPDGDPPSKGPSPHPQMPSFQIGVAGITKLIKGLNIHKAAGPDLINGRLLKECCDACAPILQLIFQRSLESGTIPNDWHNANVTPLFKRVSATKLQTTGLCP